MKQLTYIMVKPEFAEKPEVINLVKEEAKKVGMKILREKFVKYSKISKSISSYVITLSTFSSTFFNKSIIDCFFSEDVFHIRGVFC